MSVFGTGGTFLRYGDAYQLRLQTAEDLKVLTTLDETFWMATSAPTWQLRIDPGLVAFLDPDGNGRILSDDIRRAFKWLSDRLSCLDGVLEGASVLSLAHVNAEAPTGQQLVATAKQILRNLNKPDASGISLSEVRDHAAFFKVGAQNGDGVIPPDNADEALKPFLLDIIATVGGVPDLGGSAGVDKAKLDAFIASAKGLLAWKQQAEAGAENAESMFPLGENTASGYEKLSALRAVVDHYFALCRLAALNESLGRAQPNPPCPADVVADSATVHAHMQAAPIAQPRSDRTLRIGSGTNPEFEVALQALVDTVIAPILGSDWYRNRLTEDEWGRVKAAFSVYESWLNSKSGCDVEKLGPDKLKAYVEGDMAEQTGALIARDLAAGQELAALQDLETLLLLQHGFLEVCRNFVNFHNLYDPDCRALFETGRLVIGGRSFNLNIRVQDVARHSGIAAKSGIMLIYSEITGSKPEEHFNIVTPITSRFLGDLTVERRGVLFDLEGREWDARIVKAVDNPVSLWNAIVKPFIRIGTTLAKSFEKVVAGTEKQLESSLTQSTGKLETGLKGGLTQPLAAPAKAAPAAKAEGAAPQAGGAREWFLSGSVAVAALGSSFAFIAKTVSDIRLQTVFAVLLVGVAVILIPTVLIADYRLHKRNLSGLLEASGWSINATMRLTRRLAKVLAPQPLHPANARRLRTDVLRAFVRTQKKK